MTAVDDIIADLKSRGGLGDAWDAIDPDIRDDIRNQWQQIIESS